MKLLPASAALRAAVSLLAIVTGASLRADVITFEDLTLAAKSHWNGPDPTGAQGPGPFGGIEYDGKFTSGGVDFVNRYETMFGSWHGFAYSNELDTTTHGWMNEFSSFAGTNVGPTSGGNFAVAFEFVDVVGEITVAALQQMPSFTIPTGMVAAGAFVTNTTWSALSTKFGDGFAMPFGGPTGEDPDYFRIRAYGVTGDGQILTAPDFYLADYRFETPAEDYIRNTWEWFDLSALAGAERIFFDVQSTDPGTPTYFAMDDLRLEAAAVPEPSALLLACAAAGGAAWRMKRRACLREQRS
ncbi:MAG TPA: DUF4465 domain-containing protein [Caulifigura sp.]|nr:DUF4465 domain-containing protein [Caulifigura sp.]